MRTIKIIFTLCAVVFIAGCAKAPEQKTGDSRTVAKINNYMLTVEDFKGASRLMLPDGELPADAGKAKEEILNELVMKNILLQAAQERSFDKDRAFMKEIERYWEQALLKLLINKKTEEISRSVVISDREVQKEYDAMAAGPALVKSREQAVAEIRDSLRYRKIQEALGAWVEELKRKAVVQVDKDVLDSISVGEK